MRIPSKQRDRILEASSIITVLLIWELVARTILAKKQLVIAPPTEIVRETIRMIGTGELAVHAYTSMSEFVLGYGIAIVVGVSIGVFMALNPTAKTLMDPWIAALYATPRIALAPLLIVWLGIGLTSKIGLVFISSLFPILLNSYTGIKLVDQDMVEVGKAFGSSRRQMLQKILLPGALPFILTGLRLGLAHGLVGVVVGEMIGSNAGIGYMIFSAGQVFNTPRLFSGVLILMLAGIAGNEGLKYAESKLAPWASRAINQ